MYVHVCYYGGTHVFPTRQAFSYLLRFPCPVIFQVVKSLHHSCLKAGYKLDLQVRQQSHQFNQMKCLAFVFCFVLPFYRLQIVHSLMFQKQQCHQIASIKRVAVVSITTTAHCLFRGFSYSLLRRQTLSRRCRPAIRLSTTRPGRSCAPPRECAVL